MPVASMAQISQRKEKKPVRVETITVNGWGLAIVMALIKGEFHCYCALSHPDPL
jgi:hypothetical protein